MAKSCNAVRAVVVIFSYWFDLSFVAISTLQVLPKHYTTVAWLCFWLSEGKVKLEPLDRTRQEKCNSFNASCKQGLDTTRSLA